MSYEPDLLIDYDSLLAHTKTLADEKYSNNELEAKVAKFLCLQVDAGFVDFTVIRLLLCCPEMTIFNLAVRDKLDSLGVNYRTVD